MRTSLAALLLAMFVSMPLFAADAPVIELWPAGKVPGEKADLGFAFDPDGHGSHTAGIAASSNPDIGVAPGASIIAVRGLPGPNEARPSYDTVLAALQWVYANRDVYNRVLFNDGNGILPGPLGETVTTGSEEPGFSLHAADEVFRRPPLVAFRGDTKHTESEA